GSGLRLKHHVEVVPAGRLPKGQVLATVTAASSRPTRPRERAGFRTLCVAETLPRGFLASSERLQEGQYGTQGGGVQECVQEWKHKRVRKSVSTFAPSAN